ncbi:secretogranin-1 [Discoglossus pictus]
MPPTVLLLMSLLLGTLEVSSAPVEKGERPEEVVTRCIVEVLSNALAKPNAPPIDPECKEILKKSSRQHIQNEKDNEVKQYETRNLKELLGADRHQHDISEERKQYAETKIPKEQNEEKRHPMESESKVEKEEEEEEDRERKHIKEQEEDIGHSKERNFVEDEDERKSIHSNEEIIKKDNRQHDDLRESKHDIFDKKVHTADKSLEEFSEEDEEEPRSAEETMKRHHASKNWREPLSHPEEHRLAHSHEVFEDSNESKDEEEKRSYQPKHVDLGLGHEYEEKRNHHSEHRPNIDSDELNEEEADSKGQKRHFGLKSFEEHGKNNDYDKRSHYEIHSSEESREKRYFHRGSEEDREHNLEHDDKESKRHHLEEEEDARHHDERKRWSNGLNDEARLHYEQSNEDSEESEDDIEKRHAKEKAKAKERHLFQDSEEQEHMAKKEDKRHYIGEEMVDEFKRYYPEHSEEKEKKQYGEGLKQHQYGESKENFRESNDFNNEKFKPRHYEERRSPDQYGYSNNQFKWNSRYFDKDDDDHIVDSEEENKRNVPERNVLPEYSDYDWWAKRQFLEDMNHAYGEKKSQPKIHKFDIKRQYDRMDELAQLLNYKKKSVEFPDFYDSGEMKKRHFNERGSLSQKPLTEEEEKELENLAIMDLELQKIAEKFSNNRQG